MSSSLRWGVVLAVVALVSAAGGFYAGRKSANTGITGDGEIAAASGPGESRSGAAPGSTRSSTAGGSVDASVSTRPAASGTPAKAVRISAEELEEAISKMQFGMRGGAWMMRDAASIEERLMLSDLPALARAVTERKGNALGDSATFMVISAFARKDPEGAWNFAMGLPPGPVRMNALSIAMNGLVTQNPDAALQKLAAIDNLETQRQLRQMVVSGLAQKDPRRALQMVKDAKPDEQFLVQSIFMQWASRNMSEARSALAGLSGPMAQLARMGLVQALAQTNPAEAWKVASEGGASPRNGMDARFTVIDAWSRTDPQAAVSAALEISQSQVRGNALTNAFRNWANADFDAALKYAKAIPDASLKAEALTAMASGGQVALPAELFNSLIENVPPGERFQRAVTTLLSQWGNQDPKAAAAAAMKLPPGRMFTSAVSQIAQRWSDSASDKTEPLNWARNLPSGEARKAGIQSVFQKWSESDPIGASRAAANLPADERVSTLGPIARSWSQVDPKAALSWASSFSGENERREIIQAVASEWARDDPAAAASAVSALAPVDRVGATEMLVRSWASQDTNAAARYVSNLPGGEARDRGLSSLSQQMSSEDPSTAVMWASQIGDAAVRTRQIENLARNWMRQDPTAARTWIASSTLPAESKTKLLK